MTSPPLFHLQVTWTARAAVNTVNLKPGGEVVVSYLPLSHVAAQMFDMWMCICNGYLTYFAEPDALKVTSSTDILTWN